MTLPASALPANSNDGYVAAAYIVFFAIVLIYLAIMAIRLTRVERKLSELREHDDDTHGHAHGDARDGGASAGGTGAPHGEEREREKV
jgi:hypothetical protein